MLRTLSSRQKADWKSSLPRMVDAKICLQLSHGVLSVSLPVRKYIFFSTCSPMKQRKVTQTDGFQCATCQRGGPGILWPYWENKVHVVLRRKIQDSPMCEVAPEGVGKSHEIYRSLLLPCDSLPLDKPQTPSKQDGRKNKSQMSYYSINKSSLIFIANNLHPRALQSTLRPLNPVRKNSQKVQTGKKNKHQGEPQRMDSSLWDQLACNTCHKYRAQHDNHYRLWTPKHEN